MTDLERTKSILAEIEHGYIGYDNLHGDDEHGLKLIEKALKHTVPQKLIWSAGSYRCPSCQLTADKFGISWDGIVGCMRCGQIFDLEDFKK